MTTELTKAAQQACHCQTCRPITMEDMRMVLCPTCGNKRCPHANDHRNACTGSNEPGQPGSAYPASALTQRPAAQGLPELVQWHKEQAHGWRHAAMTSAADKVEPCRSSLLRMADFHESAAQAIASLPAPQQATPVQSGEPYVWLIESTKDKLSELEHNALTRLVYDYRFVCNEWKESEKLRLLDKQARKQATPEPCNPCDGMGYVDGVGDACDECGGQGATPEPVGEPRCTTCGVTLNEHHHPACGAVTAAIIGLNTIAAQDKKDRRLELAEKIRQTLRGVLTRPAPVETEPVGAREALERIASWNEHPAMLGVDYGSNGVRDYYRKIARDALTRPAPGVPEGFALVPVEPTQEMKSEGIKVEVYSEASDKIGALTWAEVAAIYRAMLAAAQAKGGV